MDRVTLQVELKGDQEALRKLQQLQQLVNQLNGKKITPTVDTAPADSALGKLKRLLTDTFNKDQKLRINDSDVDTASQSVQDLHNKVTALDNDDVDINVNTSGITAAQSAVAGLASALQGLSTMMSTIGGAFTTTGGWLQNMSGMFGGDVLGTAGRTAIGYSTVMMMQGLGNSISRFDTFRTFPRMMELMGYSADDADRAIEKLNQAVLGTPTTLNDIMDVAKDFILLTGDIDKGTDIAIAANNAFLANASDAQSVYYGMRQLRDLFSKGGLREQEWDSLFSAMGISIGVIGEEMGYTTQKVGEFKTGLKDGSVDVNEFIDALVKAGNEGGKLADMADIGKDTLSATITNLKTAFSNLGAGVLQEFSNFLGTETGKDLPATIKSVSDAIKSDFIPAVRGWVADNGDKILELLQKLADFNWKKLAGSIGDNALKLFEGLGKLFDFFGEDKVIEFISFATVWAGPLGKVFSLIGGLFNTAGSLFGSLGRGIGKGGLFGGAQNGIMSTGYLGLVTELALGFKELAKAGQEISAGDFDNLATNLTKMKELILVCGGIAVALSTVGSILTGTGLGWTVAGGEALAGGFIALIGEIAVVLGQYADVMTKLSSLSGASMPDSEQMDKMMSSLGAFARGISNYLIGTKIDKKTVEALNGVLDAIITLHDRQDVFTKLDDIDIDFDEVSTQVGALGSGLTKVVEIMNDYFGESGGIRTIQQKAKIVESIGNIIENLDSTADKLYDLRTALRRVNMRLDADGELDKNSEFGKLVTRIQAFISGLREIDNSISESEWDALAKSIKTKLDDHIVKNYNSIMESIQNLADTTTSMDFSNVPEGDDFTTMQDRMKALLDGIKSVLSVLDVNLLDPKSWDNIGLLGESAESKLILGNLSTAMTNVLEIVTTSTDVFNALKTYDARMLDSFKKDIPNLLDAINEVIVGMQENAVSANDKVTTTTLYAEAISQISTILLAVTEMIPFLNQIEEGDVMTRLTNMIAGLNIAIGQAPEDVEGTIERIAALSVAVEMLGTMVETVVTMHEKLAELEEANVSDEVNGLLGQLIAMIGGIEFSEEETDGFALLAESVTNLDAQVVNFVDVTIASLMEALQALIDRLIELTDTHLENLRSKEAETETQTDNLKLAIQGLADTCDERKSSIDNLKSSIEDAGNAADMATGSINTLAGAISQLQDKTVHVSVITDGMENYNPLLHRLVYPQNGGPIYRAVGGSVFRPRGTDTIPAMLTPGEFVMRKSAVDRIGAPILAMLNRMDISGAIDALMSKVQTPFMGGIVSYDNRKSYDNHATVNQTIYTNNPGYTYRRASRFAHAL